jgi:glycolate oxidase iron-sulfur subunit
VQYEDLLIGARTRQFERHPPPLAERAVLATLASPSLRTLALPIARMAGRLPALPATPDIPDPIPYANERGHVALFSGCVGRAYEPGTRWALASLLARAGWAVRDIPDQGSCGTAAAHAGDAAGAAALAEGNRKAFATWPVRDPARPVGPPEVIDGVVFDFPPMPTARLVLSLASGCESILRSSLDGTAEVVDAIVFLDREGERLSFRPATRRVALHRPCSQRVLGTDAAMLRLLARIPGLDLIELPDTGCCGAAGTHMLSDPARAAAFRAPLLDALAASGATELLSANIGCRLHLGSAVTLPVRHPIDFLAEHLA